MSAATLYRCTKCPVGGTFEEIERHVDTVHHGGRVDAVLGERGERQNDSAGTNALLVQTSQATETAGSVLEQQPSEGTGPASSEPERPSDDNRSLYQRPALPARTSRARRSTRHPQSPPPPTHRPGPDEQERVAQTIAEAKEAAKGGTTQGERT